ncbi:TraR/DksA family transcriptional regulator [Acetomicrobium sp. UBA5826]|uniref:TraR/DksA family transcriptional regulator n=1 Tax=Acetomicrobium sp. UBA5826 TaxID=1946039 RepID=UPI00257B47E0|nr:TraR/DksA C4-type zinc finger protein [Acetomicrobium sp. UBA5826]
MDNYCEDMKKKLIQKKEELSKVVESLLLEATDINMGELSTLDTNHLVDTAMDMLDREQITGKLESIKAMIADIDHALAKLEKKSDKFGLCERCGNVIENERLQAMPWSRYCITCKTNMDKRR